MPALTVGEAMDIAVDQCQRRGLHDTALWLGELAVDALPPVLAAPLCSEGCSPLLYQILHADDVLLLTPSGCQWQATSKGIGRAQDSAAFTFCGVISSAAEDWARRYHRIALCCFQNQEYQRCHHLLSKAALEKEAHGWPSAAPWPAAMSFLCLFALYMDGQRVKNTSSNPHRSVNPHLRVLRALLLDAFRESSTAASTSSNGKEEESGRPGGVSGGSTFTPRSPPTRTRATASSSLPALDPPVDVRRHDPFLCWLMGIVLRDLGLRQDSAVYLLAAVRRHPFLWCAWQDLMTLITREGQLEEVESILGELEPRFMADIFLASMKSTFGIAPMSLSSGASTAVATRASGCGETAGGGVSVASAASRPSAPPHLSHPPQASTPRAVNTWQLLLRTCFPNNPFLLAQLASFYYRQRKEFDRAQQIYLEIQQMDPCRLDCVADYSDLLFMRSDRLALSSLAQRVYHLDPFQAASNFVVGNYYVLLGHHERSLLYFRRATAIQPLFVAAWTLLGHAYVETKNTTAAIEAYRVVVDIDQRDYRGWYNLGQIYELLQVYHHALYYYWHTTSLRPTDPRMWTAVANCLEHEGRLGESMACLERAEACDTSSSDTYAAMVRRISTYYIEARNFPRACGYLEKLLRCRTVSQEDLLFALPFLVQYYVMQAHQRMELPARSPSFDPGSHPQPPQRDRSSSPQRASTMLPPFTQNAVDTSHRHSPTYVNPMGLSSSTPPPTTAPRTHPLHGALAPVSSGGALHHRVEEAYRHLSAAEAHLATLATLTSSTTEPPILESTTGGATRESTTHRRHRVTHVVDAGSDPRGSEQVLGEEAVPTSPTAHPPTLSMDATTRFAKFISRMRREVQLNRRLIEQHHLRGTS